MGNAHKLDLGSSNHFKNIAPIICWEIWEKERKFIARPDRVFRIWGATPRGKTRRNFRYLDLRPLLSFPFHITGLSYNQRTAITRWVTLLVLGWMVGVRSHTRRRHCIFPKIASKYGPGYQLCPIKWASKGLPLPYCLRCEPANSPLVLRSRNRSLLPHSYTLLHGAVVRHCLS